MERKLAKSCSRTEKLFFSKSDRANLFDSENNPWLGALPNFPAPLYCWKELKATVIGSKSLDWRRAGIGMGPQKFHRNKQPWKVRRRGLFIGTRSTSPRAGRNFTQQW